jgi:anti-anti-sigma regulatory factor
VALATALRCQKRSMFKISIVDTQSQRTLLVEGTLVGPWVGELRTSWRNACKERGGRRLVVDLRNLTTISRTGEDAIFDLMKEGAKFSCGNVFVKHVLKQLERKKQQELQGC